MKNQNKGFVVPLLVTIIVVLIIGGGIYVYSQNKNSDLIKAYNIKNEFYVKDLISTIGILDGNHQGSYSSFCKNGIINDSEESLAPIVTGLLNNKLNNQEKSQEARGIKCYSTRDSWAVSVDLISENNEEKNTFCIDSKGLYTNPVGKIADSKTFYCIDNTVAR